MRLRISGFVLLVLLVLLSLGLPVLTGTLAQTEVRGITQDDDEDADGNKLVQVELFADRAAITSGSKFTLAARYSIERRWHIYWENPGNSGIATRADLKAPEGFVVGAPQFPTPHRQELEGDIIQYVHEREIVVLFDVQAPKDLKPGAKVEFALQGSWLVCIEVCVSGKGESKLELAVGAADQPANEKLFQDARAQMPKPWSELEKARLQWKGDEAAPVLALVVPGATALEFFPLRHETTEMQNRTVAIGKQGGTVTIAYAFEKKTPEARPTARGVVWVKTAQGETSYRIESVYSPTK